MKNGKTGIAHFFAAFRYTVSGLVSAFRHEAAFRQDLLFSALNIIAAWCLRSRTGISFALLITSLCTILCATELLNSAIEAVVDLASPSWHELAKRAKDMGSAAVGILIALVVFCWLAVFAF